MIQINAAGWNRAKMPQVVARKKLMTFIVDDDEGARDSLRLLLEFEGLEAPEFASARNFLARVQAGDGDCLILDVHMPETSRLELLENCAPQR